jgi:hypothetical protein
MATLAGIGGERYWVHIPTTKPRAYKSGGLVAAAEAVKGSPMANEYGDTELVHVNKYEMEKLREMWGEPGINPETGLPAYGWFGKILGKVAKIAGTIILTPVLGPVGAAMAVEAASGVVRGDSIGKILKGTALTGVTAGASQIGGKVLPGLVGVSEGAGQAIGAGIGTFGGQVATGASLKDAATSGVTSGLGTYAANKAFDTAVDKNILGLGDAARFLYGIGGDISSDTGIDLGGDTRGLFRPQSPATIDAIQTDLIPNALKGLSFNPLQSVSIPAGIGGAPSVGPIIVSGTGLKDVNLTTRGGGTGGRDTGEETRTDTKDSTEDEREIVVSNPGAKGVDLTTGSGTTTGGGGGGGGDTKDSTEDEKEEIVVSNPGAKGVDLTTGSTTTATPPPPPPPNPKDTNLIDPGAGIAAADKTTPLVPRGGTYNVDPNRSDIFGQRGIANIGFDPFTYGQAAGDQPNEFLFFTQNPVTGAVTAVPTPITTPVPNQPAAPAMLAPSGNTFAEGGEIDDDMASHLMAYHKNGGHTGPGQVKGIGSGQEDKIAAWLSDGEYVWSAQDVADLGDGSTDEGVRRLDKMRHMVRRRAGRKDVKKIAKPQKGIDHMLDAVGGSK